MNIAVDTTVNVATVTNAPGLGVTIAPQGGLGANVAFNLPVAAVVQPNQTINLITVSGPQGPVGPAGSGTLNLTGQYPIFYDAGSGVVGIVSGYYVTFPDLSGASGALAAQISASSAGVNALNGLSGFITLAAINPLFVSTQGQTIYISGSGLATSGDINGLNASLNALSGYTNALVAVTGAQAWGAAQNNALNLSGNLGATGSYLYALITGNTGIANVSGYITTGQADLRYYPLVANPSGYITTGQTGQFYPDSNPRGYATSGDLTGASGALQDQVSLVSGYANYLYGKDLVYRTGNQLISGIKAFATGIHVSGDGVYFDTPTNPAWQEGLTFYDQTEHALSYYNDANDVTVNLGQEMLVRVTNKSSVDIFDGQAVFISGAQGNRPKIWLAVASGVSSENVIGVVTHDIPDNQNGYVTTQGIVRGIDMSAFVEGDPVYLSPTVPGGFTNAIPQSPNIIVKIGTVLNNSATIGSLYVDPEIIASHLAYLHDVRINTGTLQQGNLLSYDATGRYWTNVSNPSGALATGIAATGAALYSLLTGQSGQAAADYATQIDLTDTGATLQGRITSLSGFVLGASGGLEQRIFLTGAAAISYATSYANSVGFNTSGTFSASGANLQGQINSLSQGTASQTWQWQTGSSGNLIKNTPSGFILRNYMDTQTVDLTVYNLTVEGTQFINNTTNLEVGNQYIYLNASGVPQDGGIIFLRSGSTASSLLWNETAQKWQAGFSGAESTIILASDTGQFASKTQLTSTGQLLGAKIDALSGFVGQASGGLEVRIAQTGAANITYTNGAATNLSGTIGATGSLLYALVTGASGQGGLDYATKGQLTTTGQTLYNLLANASGQILTTVAVTGSQSWNAANNNGINLSGNLAVTGSDLFRLVTGMSGQSLTDYATKTQLTSTGVTLGAKIDTLSGFVGQVSGGLEARIFLTGATSIAFANGVGTIISGNLTQTGATLQGRINSLSGFVSIVSGGLEARIAQSGAATVVYANGIGTNLSGNLQLTGSNLQSQINAIRAVTGIPPADVVYTSGTQIISGTKYFVGTTYIDNLFVTGTQTVVNTQDVYVGDNWLVLNATGGARDSAIFMATGFTGVSATGAVIGWDIPSNTWRFGLASQQTDLFTLPRIASGEAVDIVDARVTALSGFTLAMSGGLEARIAQSGAAAVAYSNGVGANLSGRLSATGATLIARDLVISGVLATGSFNSGVALMAYANGIGLNLSGNLTVTGQTLNGRINSLSGFVGNVSGGLETRIAQTGQQAWSAANNNGVNLSGNLTQTGVTLNNRINSLSGWAAPAYQANITIAANYTVVGTEPRIYCNNTNPITLTFPSAATLSGFLGKVKLINTGSVNLTGVAGQTFDGSPSYIVVGRYSAREVHSNGANWYLW